MRGWRVQPGQPRALLYFGGNAEAIGAGRDWYARHFPDHTTYLLAYRGFGASAGKPSEAALKRDALALYDAIAAEHGAVDVIGRSVGSGIALHLAARRPVARMALITPYDSLVAVARHHYPWLPVDLLMRERYETADDARASRAATLLLIARHDEIIPPARAESLARSFTVAPQIQWLDTDHNTTDMDPAFALALRRHLRGEESPEGKIHSR